MIARFHYDEETLDRLLHDSLREDEQEVVDHVEACGVCQTKIDMLSRQGLSWEEVGDLLSDSDFQPVVDSNVDYESFPAFLQPSDHPDSIGRFARYEIKRILGRGGMGIVMRALDTSLGRHCAVKVLAPELATSAAARKRFSREAKSAAAVVHPHVVPIQTVDEHDGLPFLVMPVIEGQSLQQRVESEGPLSVIESVRIGLQVAEGLAAAHAQGLVHRDIKPANILLENGVERVQITDFGLARAVDDASMTRSGVIAGTPQYMSPEQAHGDEIDHRSDLFSLGSVMYFMLTGHSPFRAETTMGVLNRIGNDQPRRPQAINPEIPLWLEHVVLKLLAKSPADRFGSAQEIALQLEDCLAHVQQPTTTPLPVGVQTLADQAQRGSGENPEPNRLKDGIQQIPPIRKFIAAAAFAFFLTLAGVLIVLELNKGALTIECEADNVPIRITQDGELYEQLTVTNSGQTVRLAAGEYVVEIDGEFDGIEVVDNTVTLSRRGEETVRIVKSDGPKATQFVPSELSSVIDSLVSVSFSGRNTDSTVASAGKGWVIDFETIIIPTHLAPEGCEDERFEIVYSHGVTCLAKRVRTIGDFVLLKPASPAKHSLMPVDDDRSLKDGEAVSAVFALSDIQECLVTKARTSIVVSEGPGWKIHPPLRYDDVIETDLKQSSRTLSGAPLVTRDGKVAGMLINVRDGNLIAIPVQRILQLRERELQLMRSVFEFETNALPGFAIIGAIQNPGQYAIPVTRSPLRIADAIAMAGGLSSGAGDKVTVMRSANEQKSERSIVHTTVKDIMQSPSANLLLVPGDLISVSSAKEKKVSDATRFVPNPADDSVWNSFLNRCPADGVAVIRAANPRLRELNQDDIDGIAKEFGANVVPMNLDVVHPVYILVKDRILLDVQTGPATEKTLRHFIGGAADYLTPIQSTVQPRSVIRFDCYINERSGAHGTMNGSPHPLAGAVLAQHNDRVLLLGPASIAKYIEDGHKCLAAIQADDGTLIRVPLDVVFAGEVRAKGAEQNKLVESGLAVYEATGVPAVPSVRLASAQTKLESGTRVLSALVRRPKRRPHPALTNYAPRIHWETQTITSWGDASYGPDDDGLDLFGVSFDGDNVPTWATFTADGRLLGLVGLLDSKNETAYVMVPAGITATLRAAIPKITDPNLKEMIANRVGENEVKSVSDRVSAFNRRMQERFPNFDQPSLTDQELVACASWSHERDTELSDTVKVCLKEIARKHSFPDGWRLAGGYKTLQVEEDTVECFRISLVNDSGPELFKIRERYLSSSVSESERADNPTSGESLSRAIKRFNRRHKARVDPAQPPLTEDEVVAAIIHAQTERDETDVSDSLFEKFQNIARTRHLPEGTAFDLIPTFGTFGSDTVYTIWSVRIKMPQDEKGKEGWTYAFEIREQFVRVKHGDAGSIHWGQPGENGLQAGVRLSPPLLSYQIGQEIEFEFFYRNILGKPMPGSLPNFFTCEEIDARDADGARLKVLERQDPQIIGGWTEVGFGDEPVSRRGPPIVLASASTATEQRKKMLADYKVRTLIVAKPGQACKLTFTVANYADDSDGGLKTGEVKFDVEISAGDAAEASLGTADPE